uniref:Uncharacterized protein n=1 Tax=Rousettus aegyptiacus TaxID=9407 RepID=A0A7J8BRQ6_ROUAE|nr:hypothetical protein HJG63_009534 [Rousettus aegyptiacus]
MHREPLRNTCKHPHRSSSILQREPKDAWRPSWKRRTKVFTDLRVKRMPGPRRKGKWAPAREEDNRLGENRLADSRKQNHRALGFHVRVIPSSESRTSCNPSAVTCRFLRAGNSGLHGNVPSRKIVLCTLPKCYILD